MREEYEQMELDTRKDLDRAAEKITLDTVKDIQEMIARCGERPERVRNRHEAYGIAAEHYNAAAVAVKRLGKDCDSLLGTLSGPNYPALEATSSIVNSAMGAAQVILKAAAEMRRTLDNLYSVENNVNAPLFDLVREAAEFQNAEPAEMESDGDESETNETEE